MDEIARPETVGEVVTPREEEQVLRRAQTPEENHRYQAARRGGERAGFERAMRQIREQREQEDLARQLEEEFIAEDMELFLERYPDVDVEALDGDRSFRRFCGSRYGREPLAALYEDYLAIAGEQRAAAEARAVSRSRRETGTGSGSGGETLSARQQSELDEWNRAYPNMKMTAKEFLSR
jgi:hypothetical protein